MIDWNKVIEQALASAPAIIGAVGLAYWRLRKKQDDIEQKVDGNYRVTMKAIRAQGRLEGIKTGKRLVHDDIDHATKAIAKAAKRGARRSTDK